MRLLRFPPKDFKKFEIPVKSLLPRRWFRVHLSGFPAKFFSLNCNHRFSSPNCRWPLLYVATDARTCLFERFGDVLYGGKIAIPASVWGSYGLSSLEIPELKACDLTDDRTLKSLRIDVHYLMNHDLRPPQGWCAAIQNHPARFEAIKFKSRFNGRACLGIFDRNGLSRRIEEKFMSSLAESRPAVDWLAEHQVSLY